MSIIISIISSIINLFPFRLVSFQVIRTKLHPVEIKLVVMEQTMIWLLESNRDDPTTVALLKGRYRQAEEPVTKLVAKVTSREVKLNDIVMIVLSPESNLGRVEKKLNEFERELAAVEPVSAKYDIAMAVQEQHKVMQRGNEQNILFCDFSFGGSVV